MADNVTINNGSLTDYTIKTKEVSGVHYQEQISGNFTIRIDEGATYTYVGQAVPGTATSAAEWIIKRIENSTGNILFADGNANLDNIWDNRAILTYS